MNKKRVKISHWKTQLDTIKDTLIRINIQKTKQTKNIRGGYRENKRYHKENLERMYRKKGRGWTKQVKSKFVCKFIFQLCGFIYATFIFKRFD